jgi:hypothetical protein
MTRSGCRWSSFRESCCRWTKDWSWEAERRSGLETPPMGKKVGVVRLKKNMPSNEENDQAGDSVWASASSFSAACV